MSAVQIELPLDTPQPTWHPPAKRGSCTRDPEAGPGTCYHWWDGCPNAATRGCWFHFHRQQAQATVR